MPCRGLCRDSLQVKGIPSPLLVAVVLACRLFGVALKVTVCNTGCYELQCSLLVAVHFDMCSVIP